MSCTVEKLEGSMAKLTIEVSVEDFEKAVEKAYHKNKNKINVPGFRKGKVPRSLIEKMYGKEVFYEDAANDILPESYSKAVEECGEEIVSEPKIEVVTLEAGKPFVYTAEVALKPEIKLGEYKGVKIAKIDTVVTDEEINAVIERERENSARTISVERPVQEKDETVIDFEGFIDGVAFEGGKGDNEPLVIGSGKFIPGFEEQLIGAKKGDTVDVKVTFPEDYQAEDLKGKEALFKVVIKEVKEKELPELNDEFASEVSEYETFDEYKMATMSKLQEKKIADAKYKKEKAVVDAIVAASEINIPGPMLEAEKKQLVNNYAQRIQSQGISFDQYCKATGLTAEAMLEQVAPQAEEDIKGRLVLENIVKAENITVSDEDYEAELVKMAENYKMELDKLKEIIGEESREMIGKDIAFNKAIEFVVANCVEE